MGQIRADLQLNCDRFLSAIKTVDGAVGALEKRFSLFTRNFASIAAAGAAGAVALKTFASGVSSVLSAASETEDLQTSFSTLLGSAGAARGRLSELSRFAAATPFELPEIARASKVLETLTKGALATGDGLRLVGDVAASTGEPFTDIAVHVGRLYDGLQNGRPVGESMARLQELGVISATARGQIETLQATGQKGAAVWNIAAAEFGRFSGEMDKRSATFSGLTSTMGDSWKSLLRTFGEPFAQALKPAIEGITRALDEAQPQVALAGSTVGSLVSGCINLASAGSTVISILARFSPVIAGIGVQMLATSLRTRLGASALGRDVPNACRAAIAHLVSLRAQVTASGFSFTGMASKAKGAAGSVVASMKSMLAGIGPVGIAITVATLGFAHFMEEAAKIQQGAKTLQDLSDEKQGAFDKNVSANRSVATEDERYERLKDLSFQLDEVRKRINRVDSDFSELGDNERNNIRGELGRWALETEILKRQLSELTPEILAARKAERDLAAAAEEAKQKSEELRKELSKGMEELAKAKDSDAFEALSAIEQRNKLLKEARAHTADGVDAEIRTLNLRRTRGTLTDSEAQKMQRLLEIRKELVGIERKISDERQKQQKEAAEKATKDAEKAKEAKEKRETFEKEAGLELGKLLAESLGDQEGAKVFEREQRRQRYISEATAANITPAEAEKYATRRVALEDQAALVREQEKRKLVSVADSDRSVGLGGRAIGGFTDPLVKAQQDATKATGTLARAVEKLTERLDRKGSIVREIVGPVFK